MSNIIFDIEKINRKYQDNYMKVYNRLMNNEAFSERIADVQSSNPINTINKFLLLADKLIDAL